MEFKNESYVVEGNHLNLVKRVMLQLFRERTLNGDTQRNMAQALEVIINDAVEYESPDCTGMTPTESFHRALAILDKSQLLELLSRKKDVEEGEMITLAPNQECRDLIVMTLGIKFGMEREEINAALS